MSDATGVAEVMLGLPGFCVLDAQVACDELVVNVETIPQLTGCPECGVVATAHDRMSLPYPGSAGLRPPGAACVGQAALAL